MPNVPPPAGWYPHPDKPFMQLYWDGDAWTDQEAPNSVSPASQRNRDLRHSEKVFGLGTSEKSRDRSNAYRAIEGLRQNDQIIALLTEQNQLLADIRDRLTPPRDDAAQRAEE